MMMSNTSGGTFGPLAPLETESEIELAIQAFHVELALIVSDDEKQEYLQALDKCPDLLKTEANPLKFLRVEKYDARAAARRFALYWKYRKLAFEERAFLPLKIGQALTQEDVQLMKTGYLSFLPRNSKGDAVVIVDHDRIAQLKSLPVGYARVRVLFWMVDLINQTSLSSQTHGVAAVYMVTPFGFSLNRYSESPVKALLKAVPTKCNFQYMVYSSKGIMSYLLPLALSLYSGLVNQLLVPIYRSSSNEKEVYTKLVEYGVEPQTIPPSFGGCFSYEACIDYFLRNSGMDVIESPTVGDTNKQISNNTFERIVTAMPPESKAEYLEALRRVPLVVDCETPIALFAAACESDTGAAVQRLFAYWKARRKIFGDRAFLPMTLSGKDALTTEDLRFLDRGFAAVLPQDAKGHPVLYLDFSRFVEQQDVSAVNRLWFYCLQVASQSKAAQSEGVVVLLFVPEKGVVKNLSFDFVLNVMPVKLHMVHLLMVQSRSFRISCVKPALQEFLTALGSDRQESLAIHMLDSVPGLLSRLEGLGFQSSGLPLAAGGTWRFEIELLIWKYQQALKEQKRLGTIDAGQGTIDVYGVDDESESDDEGETLLPTSIASGNKGNSTNLVTVVDDGSSATTATITTGSASITETAEMVSNGLEQLNDALSLLPAEDRTVLMEAQRCAPGLVEKEAPLLPFLRVEGYNTWAGARRFASYWATRRRVFGEERALLAMNQSGEGALSRDDVQALGDGDKMLLPYDNQGRSVIYYDGSRLCGRSLGRKLRLSFYLWSIASENQVSQLDGCRVVFKIAPPDFDSQLTDSIRCCLEALPIKIHSIIIAICSPDNAKASHHQRPEKVPSCLTQLSGNWTLLLADSTKEMAAKLDALGMVCDGLPEALGGTWSHEQWIRWQENRVRYEWELPALNIRDHRMPHVPHYAITPLSQLTEAEKVERKRRRNVLNSRRKRDRKRVAEAGLREQVSDLRKRNRNLELEHDRLVSMLKAAQAKVTRAELWPRLSGALSMDQSSAPPLMADDDRNAPGKML